MNKPTRFYSDRQEKQVAKVIGGKQTANSGATAFHKGDVITDQWLVECKTSTSPKKSFSIKEEWLLKNEEEAFAMNREPVLCFEFNNQDNKRYYIITERQFQYLQNYMKEENYDNG